MTRKGIGRVRFAYPVDNELTITVDVFTIHTQSDYDFTGQSEQRRINQLEQVVPHFENSDADLVIVGGDFNDHPESGSRSKIKTEASLATKIIFSLQELTRF